MIECNYEAIFLKVVFHKCCFVEFVKVTHILHNWNLQDLKVALTPIRPHNRYKFHSLLCFSHGSKQKKNCFTLQHLKNTKLNKLTSCNKCSLNTIECSYQAIFLKVMFHKCSFGRIYKAIHIFHNWNFEAQLQIT